MNFEEIILRTHPLPAPSMQLLKERTTELWLPKGSHILKHGKVERSIFFIRRGIARAFVLTDGREVTFWIGQEGATIVSLKGYVRNEPGYETVELMEDTLLFRLRHADLQELFTRDVHIANWGRKYAESELLATEQRLITFLQSPAKERYEALLRGAPELLQRLPLSSIASYLGVTPVSLSRIRASLK